ncbi:MAG: primosomal protein N' [Spirochaetes bacterium]|nr:MAG: primosomal protein N' [Spirochaetota bacterium]
MSLKKNNLYLEVAFNIPNSGIFLYHPKKDDPCSPGQRVMAPIKNKLRVGYVLGEREELPEGDFEIKEIDRIIDKEPIFDRDFIQLAEWISRLYLCSVGEALSAMLPGGKKESTLPVFEPEEPLSITQHTLAPQQERAVQRIKRSQSGMFYLYGVTGSGKTEVFLHILKEVLEQGCSAIYLVPEITLTHQVMEAVKTRFREKVAILHSRLTPSQRLKEWMRIKKGEASLVVGARSAVFAPVKNLRLIIIDEEHESSYKSGAAPRYHARQVAMYRCSASKAKLVMGSATPSVEAYHLMNTGKILRLSLPERLSGGRMPDVSLVDMKRENRSISGLLIREIKRVHEEGGQTILFLNRRGFSYFFHCKTCGYTMTCRQCSVSLTFHKKRNIMLCHYCGYSTRPIQVCPACNSLDTGYSGFGTEKIEEDVQALFPELRVVRIDTDSVRKKGAMRQILNDFHSGKIDILLGTQMVAKGLNFPGVKLVGIILADTGLLLPDFRAAERTFSLIVQVSGRAGRFFPDGKVVVQTFRPENESIRYAVKMDMKGFYDQELKTREALSFPPFSRLFRIVFRGKSRSKTENIAEKFSDQIRRAVRDFAEVLGPAECPISLVAGNYRFQIILKTSSFSKTHSLLSKEVSSFKVPTGVYMEIDVDPVSML